MKKHINMLYVGVLLLLLFLAVSAFTFQRSRSLIEKSYLASEGNAAQNFASLAADNIHLTDGQVDALKSMSYAELLESDENNQLRDMMINAGLKGKVDYAYIMVHLNENEIKYTVTEDVAKRYDAPIGTDLDIMWLLDVNVGEGTEDYFSQGAPDEYNRYSYYIDEDKVIFGDVPTYIYNSGEWGDHICGYAPIYTTSGHYIGALGVDMRTGDYAAYCNKAVFAMGMLVFVSMLMLTVLFAYVYIRNRRVQYNRIYLDPLTKIYNRSYYNNRFARKMNACRKEKIFAMIIADVDWFKKVNDTFGHEVGDEVLSELAEILVAAFGKTNTVRLGGEEFVAGIWVSGREELQEKLDRLYLLIADHLFSSREITLTVSLGCAYCECGSVNGWLLSGMLRAADCKLYQAKESGRNRYITEEYDKEKQYKKEVRTKSVNDGGDK